MNYYKFIFYIFGLIIFKHCYCFNNEYVDSYFLQDSIPFKHSHLKEKYGHIDDEDIVYLEEEDDNYVGYHPRVINYEIIEGTEIGIGLARVGFKTIF
ncbi:hypothetical protein LO80_00070 [Candidatus Francisella endociliophora]|uniref:Uncharacterized protein n=1 Tax=Candidatus Francisella endociliophora TaxID=653937 RepID=A0A097ELS7_9GAMM|nr:hypothetical protein [Francisella sp. FSC1006]AIT08521.1 hypothetical protein LO80_00070 [Francisella sp. FSC1006]